MVHSTDTERTEERPEVFQAVMALVAIAADAKGTSARLSSLKAEIDAARAAKAEIEKAKADLAAAKTAQEAELGKRERELDERAEWLRKRERDVAQSRETVFAVLNEMQRLDAADAHRGDELCRHVVRF
jgi:hypothetical protein